MSKKITFDVTHCFMTQLLLRPWRESQQSTTAPLYSLSRFVRYTLFVTISVVIIFIIFPVPVCSI